MPDAEKKDGRSNGGKNLHSAAAEIGLTTAKPDQGLGAVAADMDLTELHDKFPGARFVSVKRFTAERKWESLGSVPLDILDDDYMMNEFGPGLYTLYPRDEMGKIIGSSHLIRIGERATRGRPLAGTDGAREAPAGHPTAPIQVISQNTREQLDLLKSELQRRDEMIYRMLEALGARTAPAAQAPPITILDMLTAFEKFQKLGQAAPVPFPEKLMERAFSMATKSSNGGGNEWYELIKDIWHEVKEPLMALAAPVAAAVLPPTVPAPTVPGVSTGAAGIAAPPPAGNPAQPAPPVEVPAGDIPDDGDLETVNIDLDPWISDLKAQCKAGRPAELVAGAIRAQCQASEDIAAITEEIVTGEFEDFIKLDPELAGPAMKAWFKKLFEVVRVQLLGSANDSGGPRRNAANT